MWIVRKMVKKNPVLRSEITGDWPFWFQIIVFFLYLHKIAQKALPETCEICSLSNTSYFMRVALKTVPPILLCWSITSEADVGGVAVEAEPSHQYSVICCCHLTDGSRGVDLQNGIWFFHLHMKQRGAIELFHTEKMAPTDTTINSCWKFMETKQWMWAQRSGRWYVSGVATSDRGSPLLVQVLMSMAHRLLIIAVENAQLMMVTVEK